MHARWRVCFVAGLFWLVFATTVQAGMPALTLEDIPRYLTLSKLAKMRLDAISFFLVCLLGSGWAIQLVWNSLAKDFTKLPRISYPRALGLIALWGLLFLLVLTMISGARELMTPGAWRKKGLTYELAEPAEPARAGVHEPAGKDPEPSDKEGP
ncbi:MAG TPA: hypothetical protein VG125_09270 [Pirellulales bacterium]|jgi:hypothetical protein|nr:hypothetical protein [Pirellulales bacterium]